jgi:hypothetical protein
MEKLTSLGLSFDRVLIQLIIPGMVSLTPYFILILKNNPAYKAYLLDNPTILISTFTILSLIVGIILENIGSWIEVKHFDKKNEKIFIEYNNIWEKFLTLNYEGKEPTGHRYIRNILMRMKFELSFGLSIILLSIGLILVDIEMSFINGCFPKLFFLVLIPFCTSFYLLFYEAYNSSKVLAKTREILVKKYFKEN